MSATQKVGQEIRRVRTGMGLSQKEFGELIGKSESQVGAYETAKTSIAVDVLFQNSRGGENSAGRVDYHNGSEGRKTGWDAELRIYNLEDRKQVMTILAVNGYDVGGIKRRLRRPENLLPIMSMQRIKKGTRTPPNRGKHEI